MLPDPGGLEMNFMLGSSWPTYQPLSLNRLALPLVTLIGSVHRSPASFRTVPYLLLQPLQSSSFTCFGAIAPLAAVLALAAAAAGVAPAEPLRRAGRRPQGPSPALGIAATSATSASSLAADFVVICRKNPAMTMEFAYASPFRSRVPPSRLSARTAVTPL